MVKEKGKSDKSVESPKGIHALSETNNGSMDYLSKTDSQMSKDAAKVRGHMYKDGRY